MIRNGVGRICHSAAINPDGRYAAYTMKLREIGVTDLATGDDLICSAPRLLLGYHALAFRSPTELVFASENGVLEIWDVAADRRVRSIGRPGDFRSFHVAVSPDGRLAAAERTDAGVALIDLERGEVDLDFRDERSPIWSLAFSPDGRRLAVGLSDGGLAIWDLARVDLLLENLLEAPTTRSP